MSGSGGEADREQRGAEEGGPVPVRELMRATDPEPKPDTAAPGTELEDRSFEVDGESWLVKVAGSGAYGTGRRGAARIIALHFFRAREPDTPLLEALIPTGRYPTLMPVELIELMNTATPIDLERRES